LLNVPDGEAVSGAGRIYVANWGSNTVTVYDPSASGNAAPSATISGANTLRSGPTGLAFGL
jgi:YVTN family beta-propeller protein